MIKKKFLPLQSPNERGLSSVGLERLLDRQEVGSSNLPVLTTRKRHLQRCRCLFFYSGQSPRFRQTSAHRSSFYVPTTGFAVRRGPKSAIGAPQSPAQRAEPASRCGYLAAGDGSERREREREQEQGAGAGEGRREKGAGAGAGEGAGRTGVGRTGKTTTGFPRGRRQGGWGSGGRGCGWRGPRR